MYFLFCCEFYYPSIGGVQEVMRQIAERMVQRGHQVTVATTHLESESVSELNGVKIERFKISGNDVIGVIGEVARYRDFVVRAPVDAILIKSAQQWTFDALFPILDQIKARKYFIPCGFSRFYEAAYKSYFEKMPDVLRKFDGLIFYTDNWRDIDFCRSHGLSKQFIIYNGASEREFATLDETAGFRKQLGIPEGDFVFSTVGSMTGVKGHREIAEAFVQMDVGSQRAVLVLNGNQNLAPVARVSWFDKLRPAHLVSFTRQVLGFLCREGYYRALHRAAGTILRALQKHYPADPLAGFVRRAAANPNKRIIITNLVRDDVIDLFKTTDLFVFASNIEYSPLVLFEAAAAGTPFLTVPVGNAEKIAAMTEAGIVCPAPTDAYGYTRVEPDILATAMMQAMNNPARLIQLGRAGRRNWEQKFTWDKIASQYEALLTEKIPPPPVASGNAPPVSVLLPVFNGGARLEKSVHSILAQTLQDFELLVIDDGSTDGAVARIQALNDAHIRVIGSTARRGLAARLNEGIDAARGKYIARMDADDIAFPQRLEKQLHFLEAHPDLNLIGCRAVAFRDEGLIGLLPFAARHEEICAHPWRGFPLPHPTWMGHATWFRHHRYATPEVSRAEDQDLLLRSYASSRFGCLDEVLLGYHQGTFDLRKTFTARRHWLAAQERYFVAHRQWVSALLAAAATAIKVVVDALAALPGCENLFFARMGGKVPDQVVRDFNLARGETAPAVVTSSGSRGKLIYVLTEDWFFCSHFIERAAAARTEGWDVAVMTHFSRHADEIRARGLRVIPLHIDRSSIDPLRELGVIRQIYATYRDEKPDMVHHVALKPVLYGSIAARLAGVKAVVNAPVGMGYIFISKSFKARMLRPIVALGLRFLLNPRGGKVIFENTDDRESLIKDSFVRRQDAILIRGSGIDTVLFSPQPEPPGTPTVVLTARMLWDKGVGEFVGAARRLRARGVQARFVLVGAPDPLNRASIDEKILRGWQREGVVEWLGFRSDIPAIIGGSAIVCLPSYREGLPKSLLEALACGKPVVTTDVPGCREVVIDGVNGRLVPPRNMGALAEALAELIASPEKRSAMGQAGRKMAEQEFAQTRIIAETLQVYKELKPPVA